MSLLDTASLIVTPNAYKEGKLYSVIPSDGSGDLSVTRATTATRVNSAGLVELVPYNFVLNSETTWLTDGVTIISGITDPNGGTNAYKVTNIDSGNADNYVDKVSNPMPLTPGSTITFSIYMKGSGTIATYLERSVGGTYFFDTEVHTLSSEWQRFNHTYTVSVNASGFAIYVGNLTGTTATSVDIAFPQVVFGTEAKDYYPTETRLNIPRLDYSLGGCPSILVEPQRTNIFTYSEQFDNAAWQKLNTSVTANTTTSPSGLTNADTLAADGILGSHSLSQTISVTSGVKYSYAIYAKKNTNNFVQLIPSGSIFGVNVWANFDLENGVVGSVGIDATASIESVGDGWYRCTMIATATATSSGAIYSWLVSSAISARAEQNALSTSIYIWGAQLEAGAYATSYIPTTSASVTRNADLLSKTGISSLIGQTEGTLFVQANLDHSNAANSYLIQVRANNANRIFIYRETGTDKIGCYALIGGTAIYTTLTSGSITGNVKAAFAYKSGSFAFYVNGVQVGTSSASLTIASTLTEFTIDSNNGIENGFFLYNAAALWQERLTNDQLEALTTI